MKITGGGIDEPADLGVGVVGGQGGGATVAGCNQFVGKIVANLAAGGFGVAVFDGVGVVAGLIHSVVVDLCAGRGFEADGGSGLAASRTRVGYHVVLDLATGMGRGTETKSGRAHERDEQKNVYVQGQLR